MSRYSSSGVVPALVEKRPSKHNFPTLPETNQLIARKETKAINSKKWAAGRLHKPVVALTADNSIQQLLVQGLRFTACSSMQP